MLIRVVIFSLIILVLVGMVFFVCWLIGWCAMHLFHTQRNYGVWAGGAVVLFAVYIIIYGCTIGFGKLDVRRITFASAELPKEFDGYRIVHFSDAHLGTYGLSRQHLLARNVDSINALRPDLIVFTGDIQNLEPSEILPQMQILSRLKAKDGVISCLGNHDYPIYVRDASPRQKAANLRETIGLQRQMGWTVLLNENVRITRDSGNSGGSAAEKPSIVVAGMENDGDGRRFPRMGDIAKTLRGVSDTDFVVMLQHDPTHWRDKILKESHVQLTLSGHTHASQFMLLGWSPVQYFYDDWAGVTNIGGRAINVSTGMGGFIPFRFGVPGEICLITLKSETK
ncbi:MAG: metallophosphoesterase [Prevotella sp.]|nr:metallophosphoesterase [Prevotella sp.]